MQILVSDTSVLIDLERASLLTTAFRLPWRFAVPDLLYERELKAFGGSQLVRLGLRVVELDPAEVAQSIEFRRESSVLSVPDSFALALAESRKWTLLTGDGALRTLAARRSVVCHGVLWVLDEMDRVQAATPKALHDGLQAIAAHPRCRLPAGEVGRRLKSLATRLS